MLTNCEEKGLSLQDVKDAAFTTRDFEYYLTDNKQDAEKYYVTAFWKEEEKERGLEWLKRWRKFVDDAGNGGF
jgi:hypothetical protein